MNRESIKNGALVLVLWIPLLRLRLASSKKLDALEKLIKTIETERLRAEKYQLEHYMRIYNACLFVALTALDLSIQIHDQTREFRKSRKNHYSRQLCLLLFEALEDVPAILGKDFRKALHEIWPSPEVLKRLNQITKEIDRIRKTHSQTLKKIRTVAIAHRDHDPLKQLSVIRTVEDQEIGELATEVDLAIAAVATWATEVIKKMGTLPVMLKHLNFTSEQGQGGEKFP